MPDGLLIRAAQHGDVAALAEQVAALHAHEHIVSTPARCAQHLHTLIDHPELGCTLVLIESGALVGYCLLSWCFSLEFDGRFALLDELYIAPEFRGGGRARHAIEAAIDHCRSAGASALRLEVANDNHRAAELYRRLDFRAETRQLMTRRLGANQRTSE